MERNLVQELDDLIKYFEVDFKDEIYNEYHAALEKDSENKTDTRNYFESWDQKKRRSDNQIIRKHFNILRLKFYEYNRDLIIQHSLFNSADLNKLKSGINSRLQYWYSSLSYIESFKAFDDNYSNINLDIHILNIKNFIVEMYQERFFTPLTKQMDEFFIRSYFHTEKDIDDTLYNKVDNPNENVLSNNEPLKPLEKIKNAISIYRSGKENIDIEEVQKAHSDLADILKEAEQKNKLCYLEDWKNQKVTLEQWKKNAKIKVSTELQGYIHDPELYQKILIFQKSLYRERVKELSDNLISILNSFEDKSEMREIALREHQLIGEFINTEFNLRMESRLNTTFSSFGNVPWGKLSVQMENILHHRYPCECNVDIHHEDTYLYLDALYTYNKYLKNNFIEKKTDELSSNGNLIHEEKEIPKIEIPFIQKILHPEAAKIAALLKEKFRNKKGKALRIMIEVLSKYEPPIITYEGRQRTEIYDSMKEYFDWDIGRYQSIWDVKVFAPVDYNAIKRIVDSILDSVNGKAA